MGAGDALRTIVQDLGELSEFEDKMMNGLMAEVKGLANWAEIRKNCAAKICKYSRLIGEKMEEAIHEMHQVKPEYELGHVDMTIFHQTSLTLMGENILVEVRKMNIYE
jgi:hypothetical protein